MSPLRKANFTLTRQGSKLLFRSRWYLIKKITRNEQRIQTKVSIGQNERVRPKTQHVMFLGIRSFVTSLLGMLRN